MYAGRQREMPIFSPLIGGRGVENPKPKKGVKGGGERWAGTISSVRPPPDCLSPGGGQDTAKLLETLNPKP